MTNLKIKFWDKKLSVMWEPIEVKKLLSYLLFQSMPNSDGYHALRDHFNEMIPLYSTGLYDKKGKDVFEGDIVIEGGNIGEVFYDECSARFAYKTRTGTAGLYLFAGEVIGNIYDKP